MRKLPKISKALRKRARKALQRIAWQNKVNERLAEIKKLEAIAARKK
jgi:hypothetical protein